MKRTGFFLLQSNAQRYAFAGALFGLLFPMIATSIRILESGRTFRLSSIVTAQAADPLLWIIDTAPIFLGLFAAIAGRRQDALERTNQTLRSREQELEAAQLVREQQVNERTRELASRNQSILERAENLNSVVDSSRSLLAAQELDDLLPLVVQVISREFNYSSVGIYLLDEQKQRALLMASSSAGGAGVVQREKQAKAGEQNLVDFVIRSGQTRIMENRGTDPMVKEGTEQPLNRSELVLPLKSGPNVIGALDLLSDTALVFSEEYVSILEILADLVTIAIQNAILNEKTHRSLREVEENSRQISGRAWGGWLESIKAKGYRYDGIRSEPLRKLEVSSSNGTNFQNIPIRLRGRTIGNLKIKLSDSAQGWTEDDHALAQAAAERTALALEGARLLEEAKKRAARETFLSDMATKLSTSFRLDSILRDTVEELGLTLEGSTVSFQLINPAASPDMDVASMSSRESE